MLFFIPQVHKHVFIEAAGLAISLLELYLFYPAGVIGLLLLGTTLQVFADQFFKGGADLEVKGRGMRVADPASVVMQGKIFGTGQAERVSALSQHWFQEQLQADRAAQRFLADEAVQPFPADDCSSAEGAFLNHFVLDDVTELFAGEGVSGATAGGFGGCFPASSGHNKWSVNYYSTAKNHYSHLPLSFPSEAAVFHHHGTP